MQGELAEVKGIKPVGFGNQTPNIFHHVCDFQYLLSGLHALLPGKKGVWLKKHMPCSQAQPAT